MRLKGAAGWKRRGWLEKARLVGKGAVGWKRRGLLEKARRLQRDKA